MRFKGLDLNLLVALDALLDEASVSRAAARLHLSQPAASAALARLREWFGDPLLAQHGKRLMPTPYALRLRPALTQLLAEIDALVTQPAQFDPATARRRFRICTSDYLTSVLLRPFLADIAVTAPGIELDILPPDDDAMALLDSGQIDMLIIPQEFTSQLHPSRLLLEEDHVVVGWSGNPLLADPVAAPLTIEDFSTAGHVSVRLGRVSRLAHGEAQLQARGIARRVEVVAPSFTLVPELLVGTHRLAIMHARLARLAALRDDIRIVPLPFEMARMKEMVQFHRARADDAGLRWLLERLDAIVAAEALDGTAT
ncbi:MAG: LysR family transcriptional regulator [Sphingomonadales bacterium]|nr:LysR family transcriptional regulator [Sphingomonadales bacterium]